MKDDEAGNERFPGFIIDFGEITGGKAFVVDQAIVAVFRPVGEMLPRPLDLSIIRRMSPGLIFRIRTCSAFMLPFFNYFRFRSPYIKRRKRLSVCGDSKLRQC